MFATRAASDRVRAHRILASSLLMRFSSSSRALAFLKSAINCTSPRMFELLLLDRPRKPEPVEEDMLGVSTRDSWISSRRDIRNEDSSRSPVWTAGFQIGRSGRCVLDARAELPMRARGDNVGGQGVKAQVVVDSVDGRHDGEGLPGIRFLD